MLERRNGQITIFIILGLVFVISFFFFLKLANDGNDSPADFITESVLTSFDKSSLNNYYLGCIENIVNNALLEHPPEEIGSLVEKEVIECSKVESLYLGIDFSYGVPKVVAKKNIYGNTLMVEVDYPVTFEDAGRSTTLPIFSIEIPLIQKMQLSFDSEGKVNQDLVFELLDGQINLEIPKGINAVRDVTGQVREIVYAIREARDGNIVLDLKPDGAIFSKPLILRISYENIDIPIGFNMSNLGVGVYDKELKRYKLVPGSYVDTQTKEIIAPITHFSLFTWGIIRTGSDCENNSDDVNESDINMTEYPDFVANILKNITENYANGTINVSDINLTIDNILRNSKKYMMDEAWFVNINGSFGCANLSDFNFSINITNLKLPELDDGSDDSEYYGLLDDAYDKVISYKNGTINNSVIKLNLDILFRETIDDEETDILIVNNALFDEVNLSDFSFEVNLTGIVKPSEKNSSEKDNSTTQCKEELGFSDEFDLGEFGVCATLCRFPKGTNTANIDVSEKGRHMVFGLVERGQREGCQRNEKFFLTANGARTPTSEDGSCDNTKEWEAIGQLDFLQGDNQLTMVHDGAGTGGPESVAIWELKLGAMPENDSKYYWIDNFGTEYEVEYLDELLSYTMSTSSNCVGGSINGYSFKEVAKVNDYLWHLVCVNGQVYSAAYNGDGNNNVYTLNGALFKTVDRGGESSRVYDMNGVLYMASEQKSGGPVVWKGGTKLSSNFGKGYILSGAYFNGKNLIASNIRNSHIELYDCSGNACSLFKKVNDMRAYDMVSYNDDLYLLGKKASGGFTGGVAKVYAVNSGSSKEFSNGYIVARGEVYDGKLYVGLTGFGGSGNANIKSFDGSSWVDEASFSGYGHFGDFTVHNNNLYAVVVKEGGNPELFVKDGSWKKVLDANTLKKYGVKSALNNAAGFLTSCNDKLYMNINTPTNNRKGPGYILEITPSISSNEYNASKEIKDNKGNIRNYELIIPSGYDQSKATPLMFYFHGTICPEYDYKGIDLASTELKTLAEEKNAIIVSPKAYYKPNTNMKECTQWVGAEQVTSDDVDINFIKKVLSQIKTDYNIDLGRIYGIGFSNGAWFVNLLAMKQNLFTAIVPFSGGLPPEENIKIQDVNKKYPVEFYYDDVFKPFVDKAFDAYKDNGFEVTKKSGNSATHNWNPSVNEQIWAFFSKYDSSSESSEGKLESDTGSCGSSSGSSNTQNNETFDRKKSGNLAQDVAAAQNGLTASRENLKKVASRLTEMGYESEVYNQESYFCMGSKCPFDKIIIDGSVYDILCIEACSPMKWSAPLLKSDL